MTDKILLLFDGDIVLYRAGFAAEKRYYFDSRNPPSEGGMEWETKVEAKANVELEYIEWDRHLEPLENALQNCKSIIKNTVAYIGEIYPSHNIEYVTFLSGNDEVPNFRNKIDPEYKANRKPEHKPTYIEEMKDYLIQYHCGYITQGCEADDFFGQAQTDALKNNKLPIICSIDKDLKQLSGLHYNFVTQLLEEIPEEEARAVFFRQLLEGDRADNIRGVTGVGAVKARKYIPAGLHPDGALATVTGYYRKEFGNDWLKKYNNNCDLLWIWRKIPDRCPFKVKEKTNDELQTLQESV